MYASRTLRTASRTLKVNRFQCIRLNSTASPAVETKSTPVDAKIQTIVDSISKLTLIETSSLISELKSQLNIPEMSFAAGGSAAPAAPVAEEAAEKPEAAAEKTIFNIKLESFDAKTKAKVIKEVKGLLGLSLVDSKKFVEAAPKVLKENVAKEDAEKIKATLEGLGAKVSLE
ncbi:mitochondrial nucleoid protein [Pichia kluyveri]|uniref:Mitochondrial nucleoid protein n=1 Tax=Pichia kluyveri TaxID=36015 RepID=A0AAV5R3P9_PICKL|nr:mitochondrial nucleoid protein [Pichia kluyveri]